LLATAPGRPPKRTKLRFLQNYRTEQLADTFQIEIVTPEKMVVRDVAEEMQIPGKDGYLGILPGHAPLITELAVGEITYRRENQTHRLSVAWGFAEVLPDKVTILAETAERAEEIDARRAQEAKHRAESHLATCNTEEEFKRAAGDLKRADIRLEVAAKTK
jgi:F-type H+-transporting ATPase subunit epsilon